MRRSVLILCLLSAIGAAPATARPDDDAARRLTDTLPQTAPRELQPAAGLSEKTLSPSEAARQVQRRYGGRVLAVQAEGSGYRVKVLKDGEVRVYEVNP